jgi:hypothetical protein
MPSAKYWSNFLQQMSLGPEKIRLGQGLITPALWTFAPTECFTLATVNQRDCGLSQSSRHVVASPRRQGGRTLEEPHQMNHVPKLPPHFLPEAHINIPPTLGSYIGKPPSLHNSTSPWYLLRTASFGKNMPSSGPLILYVYTVILCYNKLRDVLLIYIYIHQISYDKIW